MQVRALTSLIVSVDRVSFMSKRFHCAVIH